MAMMACVRWDRVEVVETESCGLRLSITAKNPEHNVESRPRTLESFLFESEGCWCLRMVHDRAGETSATGPDCVMSRPNNT